MNKLIKDLIEIVIAGTLILTLVSLVLVFSFWLLQEARIDWAKNSEKIELIRNQNESQGKI